MSVTLEPSQRGKNMPMSAMRKLIPVANQVKKDKGVRIIHLNLGQPDTETPAPFWNVVENFRTETSNQLAYAPSGGCPVLLKSLVKYYASAGIPFTESEMIVTIGGCEAILLAFMAVCDVGDEVIVFEPFYSNYTGLADMAGIKFQAVTTSVKDGYHLPSKEEILAKINPKTRAIMYASPGNPTGTVYTKEELQMLADICREHRK
jgi:aspartate aminotransferase